VLDTAARLFYAEGVHAVGVDRIIAAAGVAKATFYHHFPAKDELVREPKYRGCPFVNAAAEYPDPDHPVRQAIAEHRRWFRELLRDLLVADGHPDADRTADIMVALKDGLLVAADLDDPAHRSLIRDAVTRLLDAEAGTSADHR
jgi:AcrR family transcriptional regulator